MKKTLCLLLAAIMMLSLAACGKKNKDNNSSNSADGSNNASVAIEAEHYFEPEYYENMPEEMVNSSSQKFYGQSMYYIGNNDEYTTTGIYEYSLENKSVKTLAEIYNDPSADPTDEKGNIEQYAVSDDKVVYVYRTYQTDPALNDMDFSATTEADVYNYFINNWGYDTEMVKSELDSEYYSSYKNADGTFDYPGIYRKFAASDFPIIEKYYIIEKDLNGNEILTSELSDIMVDQIEGSYCRILDMALDSSGNIYLLYNSYGNEYDDYCIKVFDKDGNPGAEYRQQEYIEKFYKLTDGKIAIADYNDAGNSELRVFDAQTGTVSEEAMYGETYFSYGVVPFDTNKLLTMDSVGLNLVTDGEKESKLYMKWLDSNILGGNVYTFGLLDDGRVALYLNHFVNDKSVSEIVVLNETDKEKLLSKTQIRVATLYLNADFEQAIVDFNKKNNDYHIDVVSFNYNGDDYDNYNTYMDNFLLSLATDNTIDIIALNDSSAYNHVINFAQKGLLIDLNPFIEKDSKIDSADLVENLMDPLKYDGKQVAMPSELIVSTLIGKKSDVGDKMGWDPKTATEILKSKGDDAIFMLYTTRDEILERSMALAYNTFVNVEKGSCDFDNDTFIQALEFSKTFPEEINWEDESYSANEPERVSKGKILTGSLTVSDFDVIQQYQTVWNDEATYIGYPSAGDNNGALIWYEGLYGITKNCEDPEAAWSLISSMIKIPKDKAEYRDMYGVYNFYIFPSKKCIDLYLEVASENYTEDYTNYWDSFEIPMKPLTEDMKQKYKDCVFGTTAVAGSVPKGVMDIIKEEASSYYSGQKSAEEVAKIVQSRVKIYLSETR